MMVSICGEVSYHGRGFIVIEQQGIGYKVTLPEEVAYGLSGEIRLFTHEVVRESEREFFGFMSMAALELFWKLISISGVGPRGAQKIIYSSAIENVKAQIMKGDLAFLTSVPGVGTKTAQKIILELKGVLADEPSVSVDHEAVGALMGLGYSRRDAELVLSGIEADSTEERIRSALKQMA